MAKTNSKLKSVFYWLLAGSFIAWSWTTLYYHSYSNLWGGQNHFAIRAGEERLKTARALEAMEKSGAAPEQIYDQRMLLSLQLDENKKFAEARKVLEQESADLLKLPESEENYLRRARLEEQVAHIYMDEGLYHEARGALSRATDLVHQVANTYGSEDGQIYELSLINEMGVLTYLEASSTLDGKVREQSFGASEKIFSQVLARIDTMQADPAKLTEAGRNRLKHMKEKVASNLHLVQQDRAYESDFQRT
ncbi:MAG: hypothetical protein JSS83_26650 [Cyanobacteria bacterium SZAS LIN-3]|nr:hypothetical protein [Cyanobacteria bacterium SZAS LIN-3]